MKANRFVGVLLRVSKKELKVQNPTENLHYFFYQHGISNYLQ
jgi:hypothetical protein